MLGVRAVDTKSLEELSALTHRYRVCFEVSPEYAYVGGERREIGYAVELFGTHDEPLKAPAPGCPECAPVQSALEEIIDFVVPRELRDSRYDLHVDRNRLAFSETRGRRPDVSARITILHKQGVNRPVDACEARCLHDIVRSLRAIGALEGRWRASS